MTLLKSISDQLQRSVSYSTFRCLGKEASEDPKERRLFVGYPDKKLNVTMNLCQNVKMIWFLYCKSSHFSRS